MVEVLAGRLAWAPESNGHLHADHPVAGGERVCAIQLCEAEDVTNRGVFTKTKSYRVPHYPEAATGRAFGPLALDQVLRFCHRLDMLLTKPGKVCVFTQPNDEADRINGAVLIGAYLVLGCKWSSKAVARVLGPDSSHGFVCSFATVQLPEPERILRVSDCWDGLVLARDLGWIDACCIPNALLTAASCARHRRLSDCFDAAWIIPDRILVCADPVTTANDPNPNTFKSVFPLGEPALGKPRTWHNPAVDSPTRTPSSSPPSSVTTDDGDTDLPSSQDLGMSPMSPPSGATDAILALQMSMKMAETSQAPTDFVSLLQDSGIAMVIRTNSMQEEGMVESSYEKTRLQQYGVRHMDITLADGGCPSKQDVRKMLVGCTDLMERHGEGILFHCKGGFGRSVLMACCLMIDQYDVSGSALLGWVRIARPGAVNTPRQEKFLQAMGGRAELRRFVYGSHTSCGPGECSLQ